MIGVSGVRKMETTAVLITVLALLAAAVLLIASCGKTEKKATSPTTQGSATGNSTIDEHMNQMDGQMNSVDPNDFSDDKLSDVELGL